MLSSNLFNFGSSSFLLAILVPCRLKLSSTISHTMPSIFFGIHCKFLALHKISQELAQEHKALAYLLLRIRLKPLLRIDQVGQLQQPPNRYLLDLDDLARRDLEAHGVQLDDELQVCNRKELWIDEFEAGLHYPALDVGVLEMLYQHQLAEHLLVLGLRVDTAVLWAGLRCT
jgi:hypothetical protein